jgi:hypothetical protein
MEIASEAKNQRFAIPFRKREFQSLEHEPLLKYVY